MQLAPYVILYLRDSVFESVVSGALIKLTHTCYPTHPQLASWNYAIRHMPKFVHICIILQAVHISRYSAQFAPDE